MRESPFVSARGGRGPANLASPSIVTSMPVNIDCSATGLFVNGSLDSTRCTVAVAGAGSASSCAMPWHLCMLRASAPISA
jgi:hypothetical protein